MHEDGVYSKEQLDASFDEAVAYVRRYYGFKVNILPHAKLKDNVGEVDFDKKTVSVPRLRSKFIMYATLLHEIGHMIRLRREDNTSTLSRSLVLQTYSKTSKTGKMALLQEEFEAWDEGLALAKRKEWVMDTKAFNRFRTKCLQSYVVWCV